MLPFVLVFSLVAAKRAVKRRFALEYGTIEDADWFGKTGLTNEEERELPRYLRREFGESLEDEGALRAHDMTYLGVEPVNDEFGTVRRHLWRIPTSDGQALYAEILVDKNGQLCYSTCGSEREPSKHLTGV